MKQIILYLLDSPSGPSVAIKFEVVRLGLTCAYMNYSAREERLLGGSEGMPPRNILDFRFAEVFFGPIFE